jgi:molybdate transport system substrate-binding protein
MNSGAKLNIHMRRPSRTTVVRAFCTFALCCAGWRHAAAAEVRVAVAANFSAPMQKIAQAFEQDTGHKAVLSFGSTGGFYAQIKNGAPFDILLAADSDTPLKIEQEGLGVAGFRFTYAIGKLVLWSKQSDLVDSQGAVLRSTKFQKIAIANPKLAPYGVAAMETLRKLGALPDVLPRTVQGDNIAQTYQFVATENAQLGFVALSQVMVNGQLGLGSAWIVPSHMHKPIAQDAVLLSPGKSKPATLALLTYLQSTKAGATIQSFGYERPAP